jgi:hypothetical protein
MTSIGDPFDGVYSRVSSISSALRNECICFSYIDPEPSLEYMLDCAIVSYGGGLTSAMLV